MIASSQGTSGDMEDAIGVENGRKRILSGDSDAFEETGPEGMTREQRRKEMRRPELGARGEGGERLGTKCTADIVMEMTQYQRVVSGGE